MSLIQCASCKSDYPEIGVPFLCPNCGGIFDIVSINYTSPQEYPHENSDGIWRFRKTFILPDESPMITLGEGNTPLVWKVINGKKVAFKLEYLNPTGSFKDRGTALLVSFLKSRKIFDAIEDSSGNAGASFAAYAASASIQAKIYVPDYASGPKKKQIEAYHAEIIPIPGPRVNASIEVRRAADRGDTYASHAYLPFGLPGFATIAYELIDQIGEIPGCIILPVGQGGLLSGLIRGFEALLGSSIIEKFPKIIGVQAQACAPFWLRFTKNSDGKDFCANVSTIAEGVRIENPLRIDTVLKLMKKWDGRFHAVAEKDILPCKDSLARIGFYVEPTSALVWDLLFKYNEELPEPIVLILTGNGLKS